MDRHFRPYLSRQDTVYGVEDLPEEETAGDVPLPVLDPNIPSTSSGITVPSTGLILSHAQIHISTDSSSDSAGREAIPDGKYDAVQTEPVERTNLSATELELTQPDKETPDEPDSNTPCTMNCFCLQKCKKSKDSKSKDQTEKDKSPRTERF